MSKNITIQEGGVAKQLTVNKLKTSLVDSGTCLWVPEDEVQLTTKTITENGTYKASDDGYYGYEQVIVNIANAGVATGTDGDGDEAVVSTDPETGGFVEEKVPSRIAVITPPTNPYGIYTDGQSISTDGMVVKAYLQTGGEYGTVPNGEITLNPTTAVYDASTDRPGGEEIIDTPLDIGGASVQIGQGVPYVYCKGLDAQGNEQSIQDSPFIFGFPSGVYFTIAAVKSGPVSYGYHMIAASGSIYSGYSGTYTYNNQTVYYSTFGGSANVGNLRSLEAVTGTNAPLSTMNNSKDAEIAWSMIYGTKQEVRAGSRQTINVSWPRPLDGKVLETTFEILVAPPYSSGEE